MGVLQERLGECHIELAKFRFGRLVDSVTCALTERFVAQFMDDPHLQGGLEVLVSEAEYLAVDADEPIREVVLKEVGGGIQHSEGEGLAVQGLQERFGIARIQVREGLLKERAECILAELFDEVAVRVQRHLIGVVANEDGRVVCVDIRDDRLVIPLAIATHSALPIIMRGVFLHLSLEVFRLRPSPFFLARRGGRRGWFDNPGALC